MRFAILAIVLTFMACFAFPVGFECGVKRQQSTTKETPTRRPTMKTSWYGPGFHGKLTANGEVFDQNRLTAAHKELPFGTVILLSNPTNGKWTTARVNDRGPFWEDRELDVSRAVAKVLGMVDDGVVHLEYSIIDSRNKIPPPKVTYDGQSAD